MRCAARIGSTWYWVASPSSKSSVTTVVPAIAADGAISIAKVARIGPRTLRIRGHRTRAGTTGSSLTSSLETDQPPLGDTEPAMSHDNVALVRRFEKSWATRDLDGALECVHADFEFDWSDSIGPFVGTYRGR